MFLRLTKGGGNGKYENILYSVRITYLQPSCAAIPIVVAAFKIRVHTTTPRTTANYRTMVRTSFHNTPPAVHKI